MVMTAPPVEGVSPGSSSWWLGKLGTVLDRRKGSDARKRTMADYAAYYRGDHPLLFASPRFQEVFGGLFREFSDNFCGVRIDSLVERLGIQGFRYPDKAAADAAWRVWQANRMDAESVKAFREAFIKSECSIIVGPGADAETPEVTVEDPLQVVVVTSGRRRVVAMKRWYEAETDRMHATLYYPDRIEKFQSAQTAGWFSSSIENWSQLSAWERRESPNEAWPLRHGHGVVPVVPLVNSPDLAGEGLSELKSLVPLQGAINKLVLDMMVAAEFTAFRQRWISGLDLPKDPDTGEEVAPFRPGADSVWYFPPVKVGEQPTTAGDFEQTDLEPYVKAISMLIEHAATEGRLPIHYLLSTNVMPNAESQTAAEAGLVAKVGGKHLDFSDPFEEVNQLVFQRINRDDWAAVTNGETIWKDPEHRTESQHVDAMTKLVAIGVPQEAIWEKYGASPTEIARWKKMREEQAATVGLGALMQPPIPQDDGA